MIKSWQIIAVLLLVVFALHGKPVAFSNEFVYLLRLETNFLPNDWTFSQPANEHWLFNRLFSLPAYLVSIETVGWVGRFGVWIGCLAGLIKIGNNWGIARWPLAISIIIWLAVAQSVVGEEWIFGGFEAKTVAFLCLLFSLAGFAQKRIYVPAALAGLAFSFHPAVGLWAIVAIGLVLLTECVSRRDLLRFVVVTALFSLPGILPLISEQFSSTTNSYDDWRFVVNVRVPWHLDPFQFPRRGLVILGAMFVFQTIVFWNAESTGLKRLLKFQFALGIFFLFGVALRYFELYTLLPLSPTRLFPVFTPIFFLFSGFYLLKRPFELHYKVLISLYLLMSIVFLRPVDKGLSQIKATINAWQIGTDDLQKTYAWASTNTDESQLILSPPSRLDVWYLSRRPSVVSYSYPTYDRLTEWRRRISDLTGNLQLNSAELAHEEIQTAFNELSADHIEAIRMKYGANYLISKGKYKYPIVFATETYCVYHLPEF